MIEIKDVSFSYPNGEKVLNNVNLNIKKGECILLCGKSGCGKTTITKLINGLIPHFYEGCTLEGRVSINGIEVAKKEMYELAKFVGSVFQNPKTQFFHINSNAELAFGLENYGVPKKEMYNRIENTIYNLNIKKLINRNVLRMSGGEKQLLAFACVYAMNPEVYVLDEPTANLDEPTIELLSELLKKVKDEGKTIIIAEHRLWFLTDIIDRAVYMEEGKIKKIYNRNEFISLTNIERMKMGLRCLTQKKIEQNKSSNKGCFSVKNLCYKLKGKNIFKNISFEVSEGKILGITGRNGIGKTMLIRCIAGLKKQTSGYIMLNNHILRPKNRNRLCYMVMQDVNHQLFTNSVFRECEISKKRILPQTISKVLKEFDLNKYKESHPMALSEGQKQRLAIVTGILSSKKIILFDEPTSGLDFEHMHLVAMMLKKLSLKKHILIVVSHDAEFLELCADKIVKL